MFAAIPPRLARYRATLGLDCLLLRASVALATIGLLGWPVYATGLVSGWFAAQPR